MVALFSIILNMEWLYYQENNHLHKSSKVITFTIGIYPIVLYSFSLTIQQSPRKTY